jgi:Cu2+-exporting ATPase
MKVQTHVKAGEYVAVGASTGGSKGRDVAGAGLVARLREVRQTTFDHLLPSAVIDRTQALLKLVDDRYQLFIHNTVDRLFGSHYEKHLQTLGGTIGVDAIPEIVKLRNRQAGYAGISLVLFLTGVPVLASGAMAINLYLGWVFFQIGIKDMREKRTLTARGLSVITYIGIVLSGYVAVQSAAMMIGFLVEKLIATVKGQSHERLVNVFGALPQRARLVRGEVVVDCPLAEIRAGDVVVVQAGEVIPVDGEIIGGRASIDQHVLTGEAQPVELDVADRVFAATLVLMGEIRVQVEQANAETLAAQITKILNNTRSHQTRITLSGERIADRMALPTAGMALLAWPVWGLSSMLSVASVPMGSQLRFTTPLTLLAYLDMSARSNILIKDARSVELLSSIDTVVFDKTGTLTHEQPTICGTHVCGDLSENDLLALAAAMEQRQSHPIAAAIREAAAGQGLPLLQVDETCIQVGYGVSVMALDEARRERRVLLGSQRFMALSEVPIPDELQLLAERQQILGHTLVYLAVDGVLQGAIELQPTLRPEALDVVRALHARGLELAMITGDQEAPAQVLAAALGIDRVFANVLPEQKADLVRDLQKNGKNVMFVGDGINDGIALKQAQVSVSIAGATTVATDVAQVVLMDGTLSKLTTLLDLSQRYERDMRALYRLAVYVPVAHITGILAFGWGIASTYVIGNIVTLSAIGLAFRPIWRQERIESKQRAVADQDQD